MSQFFSELVQLFFYPISPIFRRIIPKSEFESNNDGRTIVIVERWFNLNVRHLFGKNYLEKRGFRVFMVNFPLYKGTFEESKVKLQKYLEKRNLSNVTIVGISAGAITSLLYLQEDNGWERVNKFIAVGAPFKGTWMALFISFVTSGRELLPKSRLIQKISSFKLLNPQRIISIEAKYDEMVPNGSDLPGVKDVALNILGHNNLHITSKKTYQKIAELA